MMLEWLAVIASLICVILTIRRSVVAWGVGIIGIIAYFFLFYQEKLYGEMVLQVIFLVQSVYGWYIWSNNVDKDNKTQVLNINRLELIVSGFTLVFGTGVTYYLLVTYTDTSLPSLDSITVTMSLTANMLLARRKIEACYLWMVVDIIFVGLFIIKGLFLSAALYAVFFLLALKVLLEWKRNLRLG